MTASALPPSRSTKELFEEIKAIVDANIEAGWTYTKRGAVPPPGQEMIIIDSATLLRPELGTSIHEKDRT